MLDWLGQDLEGHVTRDRVIKPSYEWNRNVIDLAIVYKYVLLIRQDLSAVEFFCGVESVVKAFRPTLNIFGRQVYMLEQVICLDLFGMLT